MFLHEEKKSIFKKGFLYTLNRKLTTDELLQISNLYGKLVAKGYDLYELLFETKGQELTIDKTTFHTTDLAYFTLRAWKESRGRYWKSNGRADTDNAANNSVPLALLLV